MRDTMMARPLCLALALTSTLVTSAAAQDAPAGEPPPPDGAAPDAALPEGSVPAPTRAVPFVNMVRADGTSRVGVEVDYLLTKGQADDLTGIRIDLYGQYVDAARGLGGYLSAPISYLGVSDSATSMADSETKLGNLEVGGIWIPRVGGPAWGLITRLGLSLPTAPDDASFSVVAFTQQFRIADVALGFPSSSYLRLSASPVYAAGKLFARADLGVDVPLYSGVDGYDPDPLVHVGLAGGLHLGQVAVSGEFALGHVFDGEDPPGSTSSDTATTLTLAARGTGKLQPYGALVIPFDDNTRDVVTVSIRAGIAAAF